jgi:hypothetical protein
MRNLSGLTALALATALGIAPAVRAQDGASCAMAYPMSSAPSTYPVDTTTGTNWINNYGPLVSASNDVLYTFTWGDEGKIGWITVTAANYPFALYVLDSCNAGAGPVPIGATATVGTMIDLAPITSPHTQYWVAVTGTAAGGAGANGTATIEIFTVPVELQYFDIE